MILPKRKSRLPLSVLASLLITLLQLPSLALAQDEPSESTASSDRELDGDPEGRASDDGESAGGRSRDIQEVIQVEGVRSAGLKEVPISVTQFGASDIQNLRIQNVADLSAYTPNLEINTSFAASNPTLFIRGVGLKDYNSNSTGAVSIWQDGIMLNSPAAQLFSLYDIEGIEVLRGPVGGVGGRNATAGQIRIHSFKPTGEWTSDASFTAGNLNAFEFEGALGFPIVPELFNDTVSARVAVSTGHRDGYTNNTCSNWDPEEFGFLESSEDNTIDFYAKLDPFDRGTTEPDGTPIPSNKQFIYRNIDAVNEYNTHPEQNKIGTFLIDGVRVGRQRDFFIIDGDLACILDNPGRVVTSRRAAKPNPPGLEGEFLPQSNVLLLEDFQGLQKTYNDIEYYAVRGQLLWEPSDRISLLGNFHWGVNRGDSFHTQPVGASPVPAGADGKTITESPGFHQKDNSDGFTEIGEFSESNPTNAPPFEAAVARPLSATKDGQGQGFAGGDVYNGFYSDDGKEFLDLMGASLNATYEPDWGRIVYVGGWESSQRDIVDEGGGCPCQDLKAIIDDETWQVTNDLRVMGEGDVFDWTIGFFQLHEDLASHNRYPSSIKFEIDQEYTQVTDAFNLGGNLHYDFLEDGAYPWLYQISFDGGVRYNWEQKKFTLSALFRKTQTGGEKTTIPEEEVDGFWHGPTGEVTLSILPVENARFYTKFTRGLKAGHFNAALTIQPKAVPCEPGEVPPCTGADEAQQSLDPVAPESILALEIGMKSSWFDDRVELNTAFFRYWYTDLQVFDIVNEFGAIPTQQLLNSDADVLGVEVELTLRPLDGLLLQVAMGWLDSTFRDFIVEKQVVAPSGVGPSVGQVALFNYAGNPLIAAPRWSLSGYTEYELPLLRWGSVIPSFNFSYKSRTYFDPTKEVMISQAPYWLLGARLAYRTPGGAIEVAGWVNNFMDQRYKNDVFDFARQFRQINEYWAEPRTFGVTISYAF